MIEWLKIHGWATFAGIALVVAWDCLSGIARRLDLLGARLELMHETMEDIREAQSGSTVEADVSELLRLKERSQPEEWRP